MFSARPVLRPFVLAVALLLTAAAVAEANPPYRWRYPPGSYYTPGLRVAPSVYVFPQMSSVPNYYYPAYPYSYSPYAGPVYSGSYYYGTWGGSYYPAYSSPYYGGSYYYYRYRIR